MWCICVTGGGGGGGSVSLGEESDGIDREVRFSVYHARARAVLLYRVVRVDRCESGTCGMNELHGTRCGRGTCGMKYIESRCGSGNPLLSLC